MSTPTAAPSPLRGLTAATLLLATIACAPAGPSPRLAENELLARTLMALWETGETDNLAQLFRADAVYDDYPNQVQYQGLEEIAGYVTHVHDWADGVTMSISELQVSEYGAVVEWVFSGVQDRPIGNRVPVATGRDVLLNGVTVIQVEDGRIRRAADYIDVLSFVLQLGSEVRLPGGSVLRYELADPSDLMGDTAGIAAPEPGDLP